MVGYYYIIQKACILKDMKEIYNLITQVLGVKSIFVLALMTLSLSIQGGILKYWIEPFTALFHNSFVNWSSKIFLKNILSIS